MTQHRFDFFAFAVIAILGAFVSCFYDPYDFQTFFYPAIVEMSHARDPYTVEGFYNPPWSLVPLLPLGWMVYEGAKSFFVAAMLVCFLLIPYKLGFKWWGVLLFVLSPPVLSCLWLGNLEWLVLVGLLVPAPFNILFYLIKPQVGIGLALLAIVGKHKTLTVLLLVILVGLWLTPGWNTRLFGMWAEIDSRPNLAIWPLGLLLGIPALGVGLLAKKRDLCLFVGPILSPWVLLYSLSGWWLGGIWILGGKHVVRKEM